MNTEINVENARQQMIGQQIRAWDVLDDRVLATLAETPREVFVPEAYQALAFADTEIPLGHGQSMMTPKVEGRLLQALALEKTDRVLEIGTGTGYLTACLAKMAGSVVSVDCFADFTDRARSRVEAQGLSNVEFVTADAFSLDFKEEFDAIAVTGSVPVRGEHFLPMLRNGGRMFIVVGRAPVMEALLVTRHQAGRATEESLFETILSPLINAERPEPFVL